MHARYRRPVTTDYTGTDGTASAGYQLPAATRAYQHTKDAIIRGDHAGGSSISEVTVCRNLGLSRTPVHEAFLRLAAEDLLTLESRKGAVVRPIPPNEAEDVLEMREAIEAASARRAVADGNAADAVPALDDALHRQAEIVGRRAEALEVAADASDPRIGHADEPPGRDAIAAFVAADDAFHTAVVAASRNPIAAHFTAFLRDRQQRLRHQLMRIRPGQLGAALEEHRHLAEALAAEDADRYAALLSKHVAMHRGIL